MNEMKWSNVAIKFNWYNSLDTLTHSLTHTNLPRYSLFCFLSLIIKRNFLLLLLNCMTFCCWWCFSQFLFCFQRFFNTMLLLFFRMIIFRKKFAIFGECFQRFIHFDLNKCVDFNIDFLWLFFLLLSNECLYYDYENSN